MAQWLQGQKYICFEVKAGNGKLKEKSVTLSHQSVQSKIQNTAGVCFTRRVCTERKSFFRQSFIAATKEFWVNLINTSL